MPRDVHEYILAEETVEKRIYLLRGKRVMLDEDLAELYGVPTKLLNRAVKRNVFRFPGDFMFQLTKEEFLRCQIGTSNEGEGGLRFQCETSKEGRGGRRYLPYAFTEQGVAMLSSVLNSQRAVLVNIQIMRTFIRLRQMVASHEDLRVKIESLEANYDRKFKVVFKAIRKLLQPPLRPKRQIGFHP